MNEIRRFSRDVATQILYQLELNGENDYAKLLSHYREICADGTYEKIHRTFMEDFAKAEVEEEQFSEKDVEILKSATGEIAESDEKFDAPKLGGEEKAEKAKKSSVKPARKPIQLKENMPLDDDYLESVLVAFVENREQVDEAIKSNLVRWSIHRIAVMDLSILRVALSEILFVDSIPYKSSVNEAVELAKVYGDDKSPAFINGLLAKFSEE